MIFGTDVDAQEEQDIGQLVLSIANAVLPLLLMVFAGFIFAKLGAFDKASLTALNTYSSFFALPFMFFRNLSQAPLTSSEAVYAISYPLVCLSHLVVVVVGTVLYNSLQKCCHRTCKSVHTHRPNGKGKTTESNGLTGLTGDPGSDIHKQGDTEETPSSVATEHVTQLIAQKDNKSESRPTCEESVFRELDQVVKGQTGGEKGSTQKLPLIRYQGFNDIVTTWVTTTWGNTVYVGTPLVKMLISERESARLPILLDMMFMLVVFPVIASLLECCKIRDQNRLKRQGFPVDGISKRQIVVRILRKVFLSPIFLGVILGLIFSFIPVTLPKMVTNTIDTIANSSLAVSIFGIGVFFVTCEFRIRPLRVTVYLLMKTVEMPLLMFGICSMLGLSTKLIRAGLTIITTIPASVTFATLMIYNLFPDKPPPSIVFGLVLLFPVEIALQLILNSIFGPYVIVD